MNSKKIAIWHNLPSGGGKRALYNHVKALISNGYYVEAWTTDMSSSTYLPLSDLIKEHHKPIKNQYERNFKIKNPIKKEQANIQLFNNHCKECVKEIEAKGFDMIFANSCVYSYMSYIGLHTKLPVLIYLGEPFRPYYEAMPENIWQAPYKELRFVKIKRLINDYKVNYSRRLRVLYEIEAAKSYDKILVNSLYSRESVLRAYGVDSSVCYLGITDDMFCTDVPQKSNYVVGLGSISFNKSVHQAIKIIGNIPETIRPTLKWIANSVNEFYYREISTLAKDLEVTIEIMINITDNDLIDIVSNAALMIYTSRLEPFGLAPLEANACGTFVVAIAEGGIRESITNGKNGFLVNGYDYDKFTEIIIPLITNSDIAKEKGVKAQKFVAENWNEKFMTKNILSEIETLF